MYSAFTGTAVRAGTEIQSRTLVRAINNAIINTSAWYVTPASSQPTTTNAQVGGSSPTFQVVTLFYFKYIQFTILALLFSLPRQVVTQTRVHIEGFSPPSPIRFVPCTFIAERRLSSFFPRRLASNCAYPR